MTTPPPNPHDSGPIVDERGQPVDDASGSEDITNDPTGQIEEPGKVMRIGTMVKQLLEEVRAAPLDEASRIRLKEIHESSIRELEMGLSSDLTDELHRLSLPFSDKTTPTDAELRIAQAALVGWLEGLFHGIQAALVAQQMAARVQLDQMHRPALPPGMHGGPPPQPGTVPGTPTGTGQYL
ncbi:MAG: bacterial proteasome activator family protein [Mycobacteriales bacterium]